MKKEHHSEEDEEFRVDDRRHWSHEDDSEASDDTSEASEPRKPSIIDAYREQAEAAERKLQEYIEAYKADRQEQERVRERLGRDVDRRVRLQFAELVGNLLQTVDDLDLALSHARTIPEAARLTEGVELARARFLSALEAQGVCRISPDGEEFDPNEAEALRVDPVGADRDGRVTETLQPGYRLGDHVVRPARVAVGRSKG